MRQLSIAAALLLSTAVLAQAPGIVWEREYDDITIFRDVIPTSDVRILCAGYRGASQTSLWCFDSGGDVLWTFGIPGIGQTGRRVATSPTGSFAVVGEVASVSSYDLFIASCSGDGSPLWQTILEKPSTQDLAFDVAALPDGGFAVCGYTQDSILATQAWVLRFDSAGDTLWTRTWGPTTYLDKAFAVEFSDGGITVLVQGKPLGYTQGRPLLLRYSMDGDLLWMSTEMIGTGLDLCKAGTGYCALRSTMMTRLDELGQILWQMPVHYLYDHDFRTIRCTMDGGFLVAGADDFTMEVPYNDWNAHLSRYDPDGNWMWTSSLESGDDNWFYSAAQLPQGGYVAAGTHYTYEDVQKAYLVRFEPETGMGQPARPVGLVLQSCVPNPGSSVFSLRWSSEASGTSGVRVYDISGRLRLDQELGLLPEGEHSLQIDLQALPSGCYFAVVTCGAGRASTKLVVLR